MTAEIGKDISKCTQILEQGDVVAIPTETVYGLAANAFNVKAVSKIFEVKNRPSFDPLIVHLSSIDSIDDLCIDIPDVFYQLYKSFCPGPITFILKKDKKVPDLISSGHDTVGIRFPNHSLTRELIEKSGFPLAAPSANPFGYVSPTSAQHVANQLGGKIPYILDGGTCKVGLESTIIDLSKGNLEVLRLGGLALEDIEDALGYPIQKIKTSSSNPNAPGMLSSHYSPGKKVVFGNFDYSLDQWKEKKVGVITFQHKLSSIPQEQQWVLSPKGDLNEAAQNLFKSLRETDKTDLDVILAEEFPNEGLGRAINDRLKRASSK